MGFGRFVKHVLLPWTMYVDTVKNMRDEGSVVKGYKKTIKETYCEDMPITSHIYKAGKNDGKVAGYNEASQKYEEKLLKQADEFINQKKVFETERGAYEKLLDAYEKEINTLEQKVDKTEAENAYLQALLIRDRKLRRIASA